MIKKWFWELLRNPAKAFLIAVLINLSQLGIDQLFLVLHLPEIASESDNLSLEQVLLGLTLKSVNITLSFLSIIFSSLFTASILYLIYRMIKSSKR